MSATDETAVEARLQALRQRLGKKQQFEVAVFDLAAAVRDHYAGASPALRKSVRPTRSPTYDSECFSIESCCCREDAPWVALSVRARDFRFQWEARLV
jgi:hypothetical protein